MYIAWVIFFMTGVRPGTLGVSEGYPTQFLDFQNIKFLRRTDGPGIILILHFLYLKGQRDPHHIRAASFNGAKFLIKQVQDATNLFCDLTVLLTMHAHGRGLFGKLTLDGVFNHPLAEVPQDPKVAKQPVIVQLKGPNNVELDVEKPANAKNFTAPLQRSAYLAGLSARVTPYSFRREFITTVARNASVEAARIFAAHKADPQGAFSRYDFGAGDYDIASLVFAQSSDISATAKERNENRRFVASAAIRAPEPVPEKDMEDFVKNKMSELPLIQGFENALTAILDAIREKFVAEEDALGRGFTPLLRFLKQKATILEPEVTEEDAYFNYPTDFQPLEPAAWSSLLSLVMSGGVLRTKAYLEAFLSKRKSARAHVMLYLRNHFRSNWLEESEGPTTEQVKERMDAAKTLPSMLQLPAESGRAISAVGGATSSKSHLGIERQLARAEPDYNLLDLNVDETEALDIAGEAEVPKWDGADDTEDTLVGDDDDDVDESAVDPLMKALRATTNGELAVVAPGEELDDDDAVDMPGTNEERAAFYEEIRARLIYLWGDCTEVGRGPQTCRCCANGVSGEPARDADENFSSGFMYVRHLNQNIHDPTETQVKLWADARCRFGFKGMYYKCPDNFSCNHPSIKRLPKFIEHLETHHARFLERLAQ